VQAIYAIKYETGRNRVINCNKQYMSFFQETEKETGVWNFTFFCWKKLFAQNAASWERSV